MNVRAAFEVTATLAGWFAAAYLVTITTLDLVPSSPPRIYVGVHPDTIALEVPQAFPWVVWIFAFAGGIAVGILLVERHRPTGHLQSAE